MTVTLDLGHVLLAVFTVGSALVAAYMYGHARGADSQWRADRTQIEACRAAHPSSGGPRRDALVIPFRPSPN